MAESDFSSPRPRKKETEKDSSILLGESVKERPSGVASPQDKQVVGKGAPSQWERCQAENKLLSPYAVWRPSRLFEEPLSKEDLKEFKDSHQVVDDTIQLPRGDSRRPPRSLLGMSGKIQEIYKCSEYSRKPKAPVPMVAVEEVVDSLEVKRQHFRHVCYQEMEGPHVVLSELQKLCRQWLVPEIHTKEQIVDLVILEQFLTIMPLEMQISVCKSGPATCAQALELAESFLLSLQETENKEFKGSGLLEESHVYSLPSEQDPSDTIESCISIKEEEEAVLLECSSHTQEKAENAAILLGISEPMELGLPPERTRSFQSLEQKGAFGKLQQKYPEKAGEQTSGVFESGNSLHWKRFEDGSLGLKKSAKTRAENGLCQNAEFLKNQKVQTIDKLPHCAPLHPRFRKQLSAEQQGKLPQHGSELPKCLFSVKCDKGSPVSHPASCQCKGEKGDKDCGHFLPLSTDRTTTPKGEKLSKGEAGGEQVSWGHDKADASRRPHQCFECGKRFGQKGTLNIHKKTHTGEKAYPCSECGKRFVTNSQLLTHKRVHTGEKPYSCSYCGNSFSRMAHLVQHQRRHTGEKPYSCPYCEKSFSVKANLITHERTHTGEKPYECSECPKTFVSSSDLKKHKRVHPGAALYVNI